MSKTEELMRVTQVIAQHRLYAADDGGMADDCHCGHDLTDGGRLDNMPAEINAAHDEHLAGLIVEGATLRDAETWEEGVRALDNSSSIFTRDTLARNPYRKEEPDEQQA